MSLDSAGELKPFVVMSWSGPKIKRKWEPIQQKIMEAVNFAEYEGVKRGHRSCDVYQLDVHSFDWQIKRVVDDGLYYQPILRSAVYKGFGHRHYHVRQIDMNTFIYGVVSNTYDDAVKFREAGLGEVDHKTTGQLLGYPECCTDWFVDIWINQRQVDPMYETALATEGHVLNEDGSVTVSGNPMYNRLLRYFAFQVIPYFTCSYECKESEKFIEWFYGLMYEYAPDECEMLLEVLNMPVTWSLHNLIIYVEHPLFRGAANGYWTPEKKVVHWRPE